MRTPAAPGGTSRQDFDDFYVAHFGDTVTLSYAYTADLAEAQDIAQEAFSRAWQRWGALEGYENPAAWVRRVVFEWNRDRWLAISVEPPGVQGSGGPTR
ncbi:MAG TPA: sigma factor [Candidatus Limnocylindrales bacterium]|nr:sigma factor [Candidatus Limnocylindrales bacterium]